MLIQDDTTRHDATGHDTRPHHRTTSTAQRCHTCFPAFEGGSQCAVGAHAVEVDLLVVTADSDHIRSRRHGNTGGSVRRRVLVLKRQPPSHNNQRVGNTTAEATTVSRNDVAL